MVNTILKELIFTAEMRISSVIIYTVTKRVNLARSSLMEYKWQGDCDNINQNNSLFKLVEREQRI